MTAYSFKRRFVGPIQVGLGMIEHILGTEYVPKRQTMRAFWREEHEGNEFTGVIIKWEPLA